LQSGHHPSWIARLVAGGHVTRTCGSALSARNGSCILYQIVVVLASISFRARPHKRSEILSAVDDAVERMRHTAGCERCRLLVDTEDQNAFTVMSEWQTTGEADAYFNSREFRIFRGIRILLREEPVIVFDEIQSRFTLSIPGR
jgi:quinol monooxygenase YgiN